MSTPSILVTGGSGLLGGYLIEALNARGLSVRALHRSIPPKLRITDPSLVEWVYGDVLDVISLDDAMAHVAGYSIINDVTARAKSKVLQAKGYPWFLAKCRDTFGPIGPVVATASSLAGQFPLTIDVTVNGLLRQHGSTEQMIHDVAALIHFLSTVTELLPGDCIATGTPSGVGPLVAGDSVSVTISGIGTLTNPVV